jgi:phosphonopyruvate decarboxylase
MFDQTDMMRIVEKYRGDAIVVAAYRSDPAWAKITTNAHRDLPFWSAMGKGSSMALGLALAQPEIKVILFDGDGSLLMNLGSLVTIGGKLPKNFYHFVMDNGVYATTGGQSVPGKGEANFADMAKAAGYPRSFEFDNLEDFAGSAEVILTQDGPVMVSVSIHPSIRTHEERVEQMSDPHRRTSGKAIAELVGEFRGS